MMSFSSAQFFFLVGVLISINAVAQQSAYDSSFGLNGLVRLSTITNDQTSDVMQLADGNLAVLGSATGTSGDQKLFLVQLNPDGTYNPQFGNGGRVDAGFNGANVKAYALTEQADFKLVAGGASHFDALLMRFLSDGTLDSSFGNGGKVVTDIPNYYSERIVDIAYLSDGKLLVMGDANQSSGDQRHLIALRYLPNGSLDPSFGNGGVLIGSRGTAAALMVQSTNNFILAGDSIGDVIMERYFPDGTLDSSFGTSGRIKIDLSLPCSLSEGIVGNNDSLWLGGHLSEILVGRKLLAIKFDVNGVLDSAYGVNGEAIHRVGDSSMGFDLNLQPSGKAIVVGRSFDNNGFARMAATRFDSAGDLDTSFGSNGVSITAFDTFPSSATSSIFQVDGKLVLAGQVGFWGALDVALVRFNMGFTTSLAPTCCEPTKVYAMPNPASNHVRFSFPSPLANASVSVFSSMGTCVYQDDGLNGDAINMDVSDLSNGYYFIRVNEHGNTFVATLVVHHM